MRKNEGAKNVRAELELHTNRFQTLEQIIAMRDNQIERIQGMLTSLMNQNVTDQGPQSFDLTPHMGPGRGVFAACGSPQPPTGGLFGTTPPPREVAAMQQPLFSADRPSEVFGQAPHPHELTASHQMASEWPRVSVMLQGRPLYRQTSRSLLQLIQLQRHLRHITRDCKTYLVTRFMRPRGWHARRR